MKNIHKINQNIYITNDEKIKEGFVLHLPTNRILEIGVFTESNGSKSFREKEYHINGIEVLICDCKKIILTTDQDLIKDGVQAIDDEFLEWFCKNSNCETVEIDKIGLVSDNGCVLWDIIYKIIIPKEEPDYTALLQPVGTKQETLEEVAEEYPKVFSENGDELFFDKQGYLIKEELSTKLHIGEVVDESYPKDFIKQEILEEAKKYAELSYYGDEVDAFVRGVKWQKEQDKNKYSEEEVFNMLMDFWKEERPGFKTNPVCVSNWFEQFKNK